MYAEKFVAITNGASAADPGATTYEMAMLRLVPTGTAPKSNVSPLGKNTPKLGGGGHQPSGENRIDARATILTSTFFLVIPAPLAVGVRLSDAAL